MAKLSALKRPQFRSRFKLAHEDFVYIADKGLETIRNHAYDFVSARIASAFPKKDGKQTPMKGHPAFIAQHGTATCCRGCLEKWHGIEKGRVLTDDQVDDIVALIMLWIDLQISQDSPLITQ